MSAQVAPPAALPNLLPKFAKPVPMSPPLTEFDPAYLARKAEIGPERIFKLKSGRQFSYFTEGREEDTAVLCLPGTGRGNLEMIPQKPLPGLFIIAVDSMGHGESSPLEKNLGLSVAVEEMLELLDHLKVKQFYLCGHSRGGVIAANIAAAAPERVLGIALIGTPCDIHHKNVTDAVAKSMKTFKTIFGGKGCYASSLRTFLKNTNFKNMWYHKDKSKDFGFAGHKTGGYKFYISKALGGAPEKNNTDHFFVSQCLDAELHGCNSPWSTWYFFSQIYEAAWPFDVADIKCRCHIYQESINQAMALQNHELIAGSEMTLWDQHGHLSIIMEFEKIVLGLVEGKIVKEGFQ